MQAWLLIARLIHIVTGVYWVGAVMFIGIFLGPSAEVLGPQAGPVMRELMRRRYFEFTAGIATLTILSGLYLVWQDSAHLDPAWFRTPFGQGISTGMAAAIIAYLVAVIGIRPTLYRMSAVMGQLAQGAPSPALIAERDAVQGRMKRLSISTFVLLVIAASAMAVARYL